MDIRRLTDSYAVSPQVAPEDMAAIAAAGFRMVIDNRPDGEIPPALQTQAMRRAALAAGLEFVANPFTSGMQTMENVTAQRAAIDAAQGPVFAYCASGNRCSVVWALAMAGRLPTDELIARPAQYGYRLDHLRPVIDSLA
jgi:uncharacterized protein (TIGR01244 family)